MFDAGTGGGEVHLIEKKALIGKSSVMQLGAAGRRSFRPRKWQTGSGLVSMNSARGKPKNTGENMCEITLDHEHTEVFTEVPATFDNAGTVETMEESPIVYASASAAEFGVEMPEFKLEKIDAVEWLQSLPNESVDLIITDPAYESMEKHRKRGTTTRLKHSKASSNDWFEIFPNARFAELFEQLYRVLRKNRHFYFFCDAETMFVAKPIAEAAGFRFWKPLVWDKKHMGTGYHYRARYEFILFFEKGKRKLNSCSICDVIERVKIHHGYPTEKPVEVSEVLVLQSTQPDELVIDPFCGSGSVGVAAMRLGRRFQGSDICAEALEITRNRLSGHGVEQHHPESEAQSREVAASSAVISQYWHRNRPILV